MSKKISIFITAGFGLAALASSFHTMAVGPGLDFSVDEGVVPAINYVIPESDSIDYSYQDCTEQQGGWLREVGYFYASSFRDEDNVAQSQINYVGANGYQIYAKYDYEAQLVGTQNTPSGQRNTYVVNVDSGSFTLYLDPNQDTEITFSDNCQLSSVNIGDDVVLGLSNNIPNGERSISNGLAQGDFKVLYSNWQFTMFGQNFFLLNPAFNYQLLVFNGNITNLMGPLNDNHRPEGSGNIFWRQQQN